MSSAQRVVVAMMDGFGMDYFEQSEIPFIERMARDGLFARVEGVFPSVTNANNVSIATAAWPDEHGICSNSVYDRARGQPAYLNAASAIRCPTIFERAAERGLETALLTCKRKTKELFGGKAGVAIAAESLDAAELELLGPAPPIYSREINYWLWEAAEKLLAARPDIALLYVHTTDYPMHRWAPEAPESLEHLARLDSIMSRIAASDPTIAFLLTADHGMNHKTRAWDLSKVCAARGSPIEFALSPERDYYEAHHRNLTGCAWVWLRKDVDREGIRSILLGLEGVEAVIDSSEVATNWHIDRDRLGDLVVLGDRDTMFGELDTEREELDSGYRAHGSFHEMDLPLIVYNWNGTLPPSDSFQHNKDLCAFLFRD